MTVAEIQKLKLGAYKVYWKSGGCSVAAIGMRFNGDPWLAPANWLSPTTPETDKRVWRKVKSVEIIEPK